MKPEITSITTMAIRDGAGEVVALIEVKPVDAGVHAQLEGLRSATDPVSDLRRVGVGIAETCQQVMQSMRHRLDELAPDEFELKFGVTISAEGGVPLISKASGEATLEVTAKWVHKPSDIQVV